MDATVVTGIFSTVSIVVGAALAYVFNALGQRSASREAERKRAQDLFGVVARGVGGLLAEKASFTVRRDSLHANLIALGVVFMRLMAGHAAGNWVEGAANGIEGMSVWDATEGARFIDRYLTARTEVGGALVQLSLMSPALQAAASDVHDAINAVGEARKKPATEAAAKQLNAALGGLRRAVTEFSEPKRRQRKRSAKAISAN